MPPPRTPRKTGAGKPTTGEPLAFRDCRDVIDLLTEYMDGMLDPGDARRLETHLATCSACAGFLASLRTARDAVRPLGAAEVPEGCRRQLRAAIARELGRARR